MNWQLMNWPLALGFAVLATLQIGCQTIAPMSSKTPVENVAQTAMAEQTDQSPEPTRMAIVWKENLLQPTGANPVRGFTGRIYFYNSQDELVTTDGELAVYGYDDSQPVQTEVADRVYVIPADKFANHYAQSELGHSYSVWIPWEPYGGFRKSISLVPIFKTKDGRVIQGSADRLSLSGRAPVNSTIAGSNASHPAANQQSQNPNQQAAPRRAVESLTIPKSLAERMANLPPNWAQAARRPAQQLDAAAQNSEGDAYNTIQRVTRATPAFEPTVESPTYTNFSDTRPVQPARRHVAAPVNNQVFGKPGTIR